MSDESIRDLLRDALAGEASVDVTDQVMEAIARLEAAKELLGLFAAPLAFFEYWDE